MNLVADIKAGLIELLRAGGFTNISEAVGADHAQQNIDRILGEPNPGTGLVLAAASTETRKGSGPKSAFSTVSA
jgi:hypothetical protein